MGTVKNMIFPRCSANMDNMEAVSRLCGTHHIITAGLFSNRSVIEILKSELAPAFQ
jgi:hypothetical protein